MHVFTTETNTSSDPGQALWLEKCIIPLHVSNSFQYTVRKAKT